MISKDHINEFSKRLAIDQFTILREYIQLVFLSIFYSTPESDHVYFKGGTAIRLLLGSGRFSEDLDFTSTAAAKDLEGTVQNTIKKMNFVIPNIICKRTDEYPSSYTGIISYQEQDMKYPLTVHLDFSLREKPETFKETVLQTDFPIVSKPVVRHMDWEEIFAEKIRAFLYRSKGRDLYDLWFLLQKGIPLDWGMIRRKMDLYRITASFDDIAHRIQNFDEKKLKDDLIKFLPNHERKFVDHLKEITMNELLSRQGFTIAESQHLEYTKIPGGSFSGGDTLLYDLNKTKVSDIKRQDENSVIVTIHTENGDEKTGHIRARTRAGVQQLGIIEAALPTVLGKSYNEFIHFEF